MSTGATIQVDDLTFYWSHDGYPYDVWLATSQDIKQAQERASRNPDYPFFANLKYILMENDTPFSEVDGFPSNYDFKVDNDGKFYALNPRGIWVEIRYVLKNERPDKLIITVDGMDREFEDWEEYEELFECYECDTEKVYRMVDTDGTNLEEHLVCPKCGKDEGVA